MKSIRTLQQALDYIYSFVDFSRTHVENLSPSNFNMDRMVQFAAKFGNPHEQYPMIHVAGTKGKGSVCAFCAKALQTSGYCTGLYTSPHLRDFAERIQVNGNPIPDQEIIDLSNTVQPIVETIDGLTTFEITTMMAFLYFRKRKVDVAVIEVGLGGRLDATNIVRPIVSVITAISRDHTQILGDTLGEIAAEKGGIIKTGVPVVLASQQEEAKQILTDIARSRCAPLIHVNQMIRVVRKSRSIHSGQTFDIYSKPPADISHANPALGKEPERDPVQLTIQLLGEHQIENAVTAYTALQQLRFAGFEISLEAIIQGFRDTKWPARFEIIHENPVVIIDAAHNRDSAIKLKNTLIEYFPRRSAVMIFGASEDKDVAGMFEELHPVVSDIVLTRSDHPRAMQMVELQRLASQYTWSMNSSEETSSALQIALAVAGETGLVLITGSIFVAACGRIAWEESFAKQGV